MQRLPPKPPALKALKDNRMPVDAFTDLPDHLRERTRVDRDSDSNSGEFVLYWMRTAVRSSENPALDVAILTAEKRQLPLLVYQAISQHYEYASDRHHMFMLQGARDVQAQFADAGISYAFHLATGEDSSPHLVTLADRAAVVVTEEMPVDPPQRFLNALKNRSATAVLCVDTACVVPMQLVQKPYTRAFKFRSATKRLYDERLTRLWPKVSAEVKNFDPAKLPFAALDLQAADLSDLVAKCEIDHAVGPVVDTVGGSAAGYRRWNRFKEKGLARYAKQRNNALLDGVSRMSAYLHYGMVSPLRLAREAAEIDNAGSEKYLDELLIWRELAYAFCFHHGSFEPWSAIPDWARQTLLAHADDVRDAVYRWEELARAKTNDAFWNAAQTSLLRQGELHNNVRMTWGKAILNWAQSPQEALQWMIDLNHRYTLDGRDPASYGGLLWCLGQFDRPFEPEQNVFGTVRPRSTKDHASRLDTAAWHRKVSAPRFDPVPKVAVIGAGISGLFAARTLADHGLEVKAFDKGRGIGGRMSTRRVDGKSCFDHGAQYFTARDRRFQRYVESWIQQGVVAAWPDADSVPSENIVVFKGGQRTQKADANKRYVGLPAMNSLCKHLACGIDVQTSKRIEKIESVGGPTDRQIRLTDDQGNDLGLYDCVVVSAPAAQSAELLVDFPKLADPISKIQMQPCWAVMATFKEAIADDWVGAFVHDSILTWAARNSTKPGRPGDAEHLLLHAGHEWTAENWERDPGEVAQEVLAAFWESSAIQHQTPIHLQAHRWKYAIPIDVPQQRCYFDADSGIVACGDWAGGPRVEGAFLSGMAAAGRILGSLKPVPVSKQMRLEF